ncbi:MAG: folate-binding protein [Anaerolineae bacterium]
MHTQFTTGNARVPANLTQVNGYSLAADYGDISAEMRAAQTGVAVMDRSAWGRLQLMGRDRLDFLQRMSTNDFAALPAGSGRVTVFTDARGRMIDRAIVYGWSDDILIVNSLSAGHRLTSWLRGFIFYRDKVNISDLTTATGMLTLYGPRATDFAQTALGVSLDTETGFTAVDELRALVGGAEGFGGSAINVVVEAADLPALWERVVDAGAMPMGYTAYERLRIAAGWPEYGHEITDMYNPLEAGLLSAVSFTKGCYIGQEVVARTDTYQKLKQHLMGLRFAVAPSVSVGAPLQIGGKNVGVLTSFAAVDNGGAGLGYVRVAYAEPGAVVQVACGDVTAEAELVALPGRWTRPFGMDSSTVSDDEDDF